MPNKTLADLRPVERVQLGYAAHEAAHATIGLLSGAVIDRAEVLRGGPQTNPYGSAGFCRYAPFNFEAGLRRADILAAGTAGEAILHHGARPSSFQLSALLDENGSDRDELAKLTRYQRGATPSDSLSAVLPLVLRCWQPIARLAGQLHAEGVIDHAAVLAALGVPSADEAPLYAAMIRSGATPGSFHIDGTVRF